MNSFQFAQTPLLHFGAGKISLLPALARSYGNTVLLITGARSFSDSAYGTAVIESMQQTGLVVKQASIEHEPSPAMIDAIVQQQKATMPAVVIAIGGGSVVDAGKAISAMLPSGDAVKDYLEGVGTKNHTGQKIPFIAVPTTAGTGSEATKNAVLSEVGIAGYKKSLRHTNFVPDIALIDPALMVSCPKDITAASGMDAFTQLLESYLSTQANAVSDALALQGLHCIARSLRRAYADGSDLAARSDMALAAYLSGITLANAGLGLVHGFASAVGGYFPVSHGVVCSALMAPANEVTVTLLRKGNDATALFKYAAAGKLFSGASDKSDAYYTDALLALIRQWTTDLKIPSLKNFGIAVSDFDRIIASSDSKNNPVTLDKESMAEVLQRAIA
jgi:alcohol dehydrogenase class IV